jgi:hypothetical protein
VAQHFNSTFIFSPLQRLRTRWEESRIVRPLMIGALLWMLMMGWLAAVLVL